MTRAKGRKQAKIAMAKEQRYVPLSNRGMGFRDSQFYIGDSPNHYGPVDRDGNALQLGDHNKGWYNTLAQCRAACDRLNGAAAKKYVVTYRLTFTNTEEIEAESPEDAERKFRALEEEQGELDALGGTEDGYKIESIEEAAKV